MATILATWELGRGYGHVAPLASVARQLRAIGHDVILAARDATTARAAGTGSFFRIIQAPLYPLLKPVRSARTYGEVIADGGLVDTEGGGAVLEAWLDLFDLLSPAAILAEHAPMSLLAAAIAGLPAVRTGSGFFVPPVARPMPSLQPWRPIGLAERIAADEPVNRTIEQLWRRFASGEAPDLAGLLETSREFPASFAELDHYGEQRDRRYWGPLEPFSGRARPEWPQGDGPRLLVYLSFAHARATPLLEGLEASGWPVIWHSRQTAPRPLALNIRFSAEPLDLPFLLQGAAMLVNAAGHGACALAACRGVPLLMFPDTLEATLVARRIVDQRLGIAAPPAQRDEELPATIRNELEDPGKVTARAAFKNRHASYDPRAAALAIARAVTGPATDD